MKKVYVAGAYSANNVVDVLINIGRGEEFAAEIFLSGFAPFCPWHDKDYVIKNWRHKDKLTVQMFYDFSIEWLRCCDIMFLVPGWENSSGTRKEIEIAQSLGIPIVDSLIDLDKLK